MRPVTQKAKGGGSKPPRLDVDEQIYPCEFLELATLRHKEYNWQTIGDWFGVDWKIAEQTWLTFCADETGEPLPLNKVEK